MHISLPSSMKNIPLIQELIRQNLSIGQTSQGKFYFSYLFLTGHPIPWVPFPEIHISLYWFVPVVQRLRKNILPKCKDNTSLHLLHCNFALPSSRKPSPGQVWSPVSDGILRILLPRRSAREHDCPIINPISYFRTDTMTSLTNCRMFPGEKSCLLLATETSLPPLKPWHLQVFQNGQTRLTTVTTESRIIS